MLTSNPSRFLSSVLRPRRLAGIAALLLAACGADAPVGDSQVAVKVNKGEISVHQVQSILSRQPRQVSDQPEAASKVLEILIDQELAAQAAIGQGLEHAPDVVQALQLARREVLARAFREQVAARATGPSSDEVDRYYDGHPAVFGQRRLYTIQEFAVEASAPQAAGLAAIAKRARNAEEVENLLREAALKQRSRRFVQAAEDVPAIVLEPLSRLERGQSLAVTEGAVPRIFTVLDVQSAPIERRQAADSIAAYLVNERKRQLVVPAMKALRDAAQLHYQGGFAKSPGAAPPAATLASEAN